DDKAARKVLLGFLFEPGRVRTSRALTAFRSAHSFGRAPVSQRQPHSKGEAARRFGCCFGPAFVGGVFGGSAIAYPYYAYPYAYPYALPLRARHSRLHPV